MPGTVEYRTSLLQNVQYRSNGADTAEFTGYAIVYDSPTQIEDQLGRYSERIKRGAAKRALSERQSVPLLVNHDDRGVPLARFPGSMRLTEDDRGVRVDATLDLRSPSAMDVAVALERRDFRGMSFAFSAKQDRWNSRYDEREVEDLDLFDVSIVTTPAYLATTAKLRSDLTRARRIVADHRAGRILSSANETLLKQALDGIKAADGAIQTVLSSSSTSPAENDGGNDNGDTNDQWGSAGSQGTAGSPGGAFAGNALQPIDGLGPRSALPFSVARAQDAIDRAKRGKYSAAEVNKMAQAGQAFKNADGTGAWPVADRDDLAEAINKLQLNGQSSDFNAVRLFLIGRAQALNLEAMIPPSWDPETGAVGHDNTNAAGRSIQRAEDAIYIARALGGGPLSVRPGFAPSPAARGKLKRARATERFTSRPKKKLRGRALATHSAEAAQVTRRRRGQP